MKPIAPLLSLSLILTAPGLSCFEAAAASFNIVRVTPPSSAMSFNPGSLGRLPVSYQGAGLTAPGLLPPPSLTSALTLPRGYPQSSATALPTLAGAAAPAAVPAAVEPGASWQQRLSSLGDEIKAIVSSRDIGDQAAGLGRIFEADRILSATTPGEGGFVPATRKAASGLKTPKAAAGGAGQISPEGMREHRFEALMDERAERYRSAHARLEFLSGHANGLSSALVSHMDWMLLPIVGFTLAWNMPVLAAVALLTLAATAARSYALYKVADRIGGLYESWGQGLQSLLRLEPSLDGSEKARLAQGMYDLLSFPRRVRVFGRYYPISVDENWHRWASIFRTHLASFLDDRSRRELVRLSFERSQYALGRISQRDTTDANAYFSVLMPLRLHTLLNERQKKDSIESMLEFYERALWVQGFTYPMDGQGFDEVDQMLRDRQIPRESIRSFYPRFYALLDRQPFLESRPLLLKVLNRMRENFKEKI
ncbi:MAG: hypothetical protein AAB320_00360 [Elusimicrobiota bacterium]